MFNEKLDLAPGLWRVLRMEDKRLTKRLLDYWNRLRKDLPLPLWSSFNIAGLADVWGQCCVWRVDVGDASRNAQHYIYEYVGENAREALGKDLTGLVFMSRFQQFPGAKIAERIGEAVELAQPLSDEGSFVNEKNKVVKYRSCLLPFGDKKSKVTHVVLGLSWRMF